MDNTKKQAEQELGICKEQVWLRHLLDLTLKNNLLNFRFQKDCLHVYSHGITAFMDATEGINKFTLVGTPSPEPAYFGGISNNGLSALTQLELKSGTMRCYTPQDGLEEVASSLIRKARSSEEEEGANTLYLALGFLKWRAIDDTDDKYAPIVLLPATLRRKKNIGIILETGEDYEVNTTLIEFLKREFEINFNFPPDKSLSPMEIILEFRAKTAHIAGCFVYEDIYLARFTFARFAMWTDLKNNINVFKSNPIISHFTDCTKFLNNKSEDISEDECDASFVLAPLPYDSAQFSAISEGTRGTTFVLHGPPGTGKSQTIANIIANALGRGKRVLFVAQKQAALQVVKKRLNEINLGDFCLELHSGKTADKGEIIRSIENTLELTSDFDGSAYRAAAGKIKDVRRTLYEPFYALHKKRRLGISVYEGIVSYLTVKNAPDLMEIESSFYDGLTQKRFEEYESMLTAVQAEAKECGSVHRSPFKGVNLTVCDKKIKFSVVSSAKTLLAELKHLKVCLNIFLETFNQSISRFTYEKLKSLTDILKTLKSGNLEVFFKCGEENLHKFYNSSLVYDRETERWLKNFKYFPGISKYLPEMKDELKKWDENYLSSRTLLAVSKKINRCAGGHVSEREGFKWLKRAYRAETAKQDMLSVKELSSQFLYFGVINEKKRAEFMRPLYGFHSVCSKTFTDYNADSMNSVCANYFGALDSVIDGILASSTRFEARLKSHLEIIHADEAPEKEDLFEYYTKKCNALIENIDMLPAWCRYRATAKKLNDCGLTFITDGIEEGKISGEQILSSFKKNVYRNFIQTAIASDECLATFSAGVLQESASAFSALTEEFYSLTRQKIRSLLISKLSSVQTEWPLALEMMTFRRKIKGNMRSFKLRELFYEIPGLLKLTSPCVLMSPEAVSKYLPAQTGLFDTVIFDEASQIPTPEAVPALARAKSAIIVGDQNQMPPTAFFSGTAYGEDTQGELESVLEDCLALGIPEKRLLWHYRSGHESLIAFSNAMYYDSKLCTFPSPDALNCKVGLKFIENGVYERGETKCNRAEAEALVNEVISRLKDEKLCKSSLGIVTFSAPQQNLIEKMLSKAIIANKLEERAYEREEPVFVKNLESVQGDERDVILFSVCYGHDSAGKISLNFGPLNRLGGWRRLNVALSRAREEMIVFSSMKYSDIDIAHTASRGVADLKAFLEYAEKGKMNINAKTAEIQSGRKIGAFIAEELKACGYDCRLDVGVSDFKIDVGILNPADKKRFILAILTDGTNKFSVKDREIMQIQALKRGGWNVYRLYTINFFNNPKREIKKIKELLDSLTNGDKRLSLNFKKPYRTARFKREKKSPEYILSGEHDGEITRVIKRVVEAEEPISLQFLLRRTLSVYGIEKCGVKLEGKLKNLIRSCNFLSCEMVGNTYLYRTEKHFAFNKFRVEENTSLRRAHADYTPFDIISLLKEILINKVSLYSDEAVSALIKELKVPKKSEKLINHINSCIDEGVRRGIFTRSVSDAISLA